MIEWKELEVCGVRATETIKFMKTYTKHLIECSCSLPQFKNNVPPVFHKFVVFSEILETGLLESSYAQCNNCDAIHKVVEVGKSKQLPKETMNSLPRIDDIKTCLPDKMVKILESYKSELVVWQEAKFIIENEKWGTPIILTREEDDGNVVGKFLLVLGDNLFKVDNFKSEGASNE